MLPERVHHDRVVGTATCIVQARDLVPQPLQYKPRQVNESKSTQLMLALRLYPWQLEALLQKLQRLCPSVSFANDQHDTKPPDQTL